MVPGGDRADLARSKRHPAATRLVGTSHDGGNTEARVGERRYAAEDMRRERGRAHENYFQRQCDFRS